MQNFKMATIRWTGRWPIFARSAKVGWRTLKLNLRVHDCSSAKGLLLSHPEKQNGSF